MGQTEDLAAIVECGVIAIVRLRAGGDLVGVARALRDGGIRAIEFTMTTPGALDALEGARREMGDDVLLGAGTVLDPETARLAILAGARFVVAPAVNLETIELCRRYSVLAVPGAFTPTEILSAWQSGADLVKVFPAGSLGPQYIRDVHAPLPHVRLLPTGGVNLENAGRFIEAGAAALAVGGNLVDPGDMSSQRWEAIAGKAHAYVAAVAAARARERRP